jgi:putative DNA primase/helicase
MRVEGRAFPQAAVRAAELLGRHELIRSSPKAESAAHPTAPVGCSIAEYAAAKALPEDYLRTLGLIDTTYARRPAIKTPYRATGGTEIAVRYRVALDGADKFRWAKGTKAFLYGLDRLGDAKDAEFVVMVEGESDTQTLWFAGFPAVGLPGATTWNEDRDAPLLADLKTIFVVIEPDTGGATVLKWLRRSSIAPRARLVRLKGAKDASELHIKDPAGFRAAFQQALDEALPYTPPADPKEKDTAKSGRALDLHEPEPWPEPIDGAPLLDEMVRSIRRYVVLGQVEADAVALWVLATHAFGRFFIFPRLLLTSPEKRCGKSTLLDAIERIVPRPLGCSNISASALFRTVEAARPTLLLDEADSFARDNEDLRGVLNAGHKANGVVIRVTENGKDYEPRQFSVFCPIALAAIGHLPGTVEDRSVIVRLKRRRPDEKVESLRLDRPNGLDRLARMAARWAADHGGTIAEIDPLIPGGVINRAADNWRPLLAIAEIVGGEWPGRARRAATLINGEADDESWRAQLLTDIHAAFGAKNTDRISSDDLVTHLISLEDRPWPEFKNGRPLSKPQLARLLKPLGVSSGSIRLDDGRTPKGYHLRAFDDAFARYTHSPNRHTATSGANHSETADFKTPQENGCGVSESPGEPCVSAGCGGVALCEPPNSEMAGESDDKPGRWREPL